MTNRFNFAPVVRSIQWSLRVLALLLTLVAPAVAEPGRESRTPVANCAIIAVPEGSKLVSHMYADGVQIYRWTGTTWSFVGPSATLSADAEGNSTVGIHYAGPTWYSVSGSRVVGAVRERCPVDPNSIPWLLLDAVADGQGIFERVTLIQRVNTVGGNAPSTPGIAVGEVARVPYKAEYLFYRTN